MGKGETKKFGYFRFGDAPVLTQIYDCGSCDFLSASQYSQSILNGQMQKKNNEEFFNLLIIIIS